MPAPDPERGLDPGHVLAICAQAISPPGRLVHAVARPGGVLVCLSSRPAARDVRAALDRVGYLVATAGTGRDLLVRGWSPGNLESRLEAMRAVIQQLADHQSVTARAVIGQFRDRPGGLAADAALIRGCLIRPGTGCGPGWLPAPASTPRTTRPSSPRIPVTRCGCGPPGRWNSRSTTSSSVTCGSPGTPWTCSPP